MRKTLLSLGVLVAALPFAAFAAGGADTAVVDAAMNRDFAAVRTLIAQHANVKSAQADGSTALHWAAHWDNLDAVDALIKAGADAMAATRLGATPLFIAIEDGNPAMIKRLLAAGANVNAPFLSNGETPLMVAARTGNLESARILLDAGANIEAKDTFRETTALIWAAEQNHAQMVSLLLSRGANPQAVSKVTFPLGRANADDDAVESADALPKNANAKGGVTALMVATREKATDTIRVLLDGGAPINERAGNGATALLVALQNGDAATAKLLVERGADLDLANGKGWNPLYLAVKARTREVGTVPNPVIDTSAMLDVIRMMLDKGANPNLRLKANTESYGATTWLKEAGATPFVRAAWCGDLEVMKLLLAHGADPMIAATDGTNALMALSGVGYGDGFTTDFGSPQESLEAMKLLLELGIPVNAVNKDKIAAIHAAAHKNFVLGIQYLADHGADFTLRSHYVSQFERTGNNGNTVLDWATGVMVNGQSSSYKTEAVALVTKLMQERNIPIESLSTTKGGLAVQKKSD
jgi:uncharacterized protein